MSTWEESTWIAVGASALAAVTLVAVLVLAARLARLRGALREEAAHAQEETHWALEEGERARTELRRLRHVSEIGGTLDLESVLRRALEAAAKFGNATAAMILLADGDEEPLVATLGLSAEESSRELLGLPPESGRARAVTLTYRYTKDEAEHDEFRLRRALAVPVTSDEGERVGTLAIFWRRAEREVTDEELVGIEALTAALSSTLENALRFDEVRSLIHIDPLTGLHTRRYLRESLARECARARRYERRLSLVLLRLGTAVSANSLATAGERLRAAVRSADVACHLEDGRFAVLLPEAHLADAERLYHRLQLAVGAKLGTNGRVRIPAGIVEARPEDDPVSFLERAESALAREEATGGGLGTLVEPLS